MWKVGSEPDAPLRAFEKETRWKNGNVVKTIFQREIGSVGRGAHFAIMDFPRWYPKAMLTQLLLAREHGPMNKEKRAPGKLGTVQPIGIPNFASYIVVDDKVLVPNSGKKRYDAYTVSPLDGLLQLTYSIPCKKYWTSFELWVPNGIVPMTPRNKTALKPSFIVIEKSTNSVGVHDLQTGLLEDEYFTSSSSTERYEEFDYWACLDQLALKSVKSSLPSGIAEDFIVLSHPKLGQVYRIQVKKEAVKGTTGVEIIDGFLMLRFSNRLELCSLDEILETCVLDIPPSGFIPPGSVTHIVTQKPKVLLKLKTSSIFEVGPSSSPIHFITSSDHGFFNVLELDKSLAIHPVGNEILAQSPFLGLKDVDVSDDRMTFHPDGTLRIIYNGQNWIRVIGIQQSDGEDNLLVGQLYEIFFKKFGPQSTKVPKQSARDGLRRGPRKNYDESANTDVICKWEYDADTDLIFILEAFPGSCSFFMYSNLSWDCVRVISGGPLPPLGMYYNCNSVIFDVAETFLAVRYSNKTESNSKGSKAKISCFPLYTAMDPSDLRDSDSDESGFSWVRITGRPRNSDRESSVY